MRPGRDLARLAARQHRVVSTRQLRALGFSPSMITDWMQAGHIHRVHRGVYVVGTPDLTPLGRAMAAVLACGDGAAVSHRSAAALWRLRPEWKGAVEVTVPVRRRSRRGIRVHVARAKVTTHLGIPVTTPEQTVSDLASVLTPRAVEKARAIAEREGLVAPSDVPLAFTRSSLEDWFVDLIRGSGLPQPRFNQIVHGREVDAYWPDHGLVVEVDSWKYHSDRAAFTADREKDAFLMSKGLRVLRITPDQPAPLAALAGALSSASPAAVRA